jgi:hypothetical protein
MLAVFNGGHGVLGMEKIGRGDIDDIHRATPAHCFYAFEDLDAIVGSVLFSCFFSVIRASSESVARYFFESKRNRAPRGSQSS